MSSSSRMTIMMSVVAVLVVVLEMVGSMDMTCIAVLDALLRGCIEAVLEHRSCIAVVDTAGADAGADAGVVDAGDVAGAEVDVVAVQ